MKAQITKIEFAHVGRKEGRTCDRCGQYIMNIWTVRFSNNETIHFGMDCFEKLYKQGGLSAYGIKEFKRLLKHIRKETEMYEKWKNMTEEQARAEAESAGLKLVTEDRETAFYGETFEDYKNWLLNEWFPQRFKENDETLKRFEKIGFEI